MVQKVDVLVCLKVRKKEESRESNKKRITKEER